MKIAMLASECNPLAKTGGLADVVFALSEQLQDMGQEVVIVMPYYRSVAKNPKTPKLKDLGSEDIGLSWRHHDADFHSCEIGKVKFYLVGNGHYFDRDRVYGYDDDGERFAFFSLAALRLLKKIDFSPDVIHIHDWQVGMVPALCKVGYAGDPFFANTKFVSTIHNPAFKGILDPGALGELYNLPYWLYEDGTARFEGKVSTLKCGIMLADKITTVSPTHREELLTPALSQGLSSVLRLRELDFCGFVNGIDSAEWDSTKDPLLRHHFSPKTLVEGKKACKEDLYAKLGLKDFGGPLYGLVSRLTYQKGIDLVLSAIRDELVNHGANFVVVGSGEYELEQALEALRREFPEQVGTYIGYSNEMAHAVYAASDFFLMPSLFEPCGIGQMIAERYGALPIARDTGGLHDTIDDYRVHGEKADGFLFRDYNADGMRYGFGQAEEVFQDKKLLHKLMKNAMEADHSWKSSAELYLGLYRAIVK